MNTNMGNKFLNHKQENLFFNFLFPIYTFNWKFQTFFFTFMAFFCRIRYYQIMKLYSFLPSNFLTTMGMALILFLKSPLRKIFEFFNNVGLAVPLNLHFFCIKIVSNKKSFLFQINILASNTSMATDRREGLHGNTPYNPNEWGSTTTEQGTRVSRRLAEDQVMDVVALDPPPAPPALQITDAPSASTDVVQVSDESILDEPEEPESAAPMETDNIPPGNKTGMSSVETNSDEFRKTQLQSFI